MNDHHFEPAGADVERVESVVGDVVVKPELAVAVVESAAEAGSSAAEPAVAVADEVEVELVADAAAVEPVSVAVVGVAAAACKRIVVALCPAAAGASFGSAACQ